MPTEPRAAGRAAFAFIFVTVLLDTLALGLIVPLLPKLIEQFNGGDMSAAAAQVGVFGFVFAGMQFLFAPVIGTLSDRFGRRPVVLLSNLGMGCDYILDGAGAVAVVAVDWACDLGAHLGQLSDGERLYFGHHSA